MASVYALVVAAGRGSRFGGAVPKQYLPLGGGSVLRHAVLALAGNPRLSGVLAAIRPEDRELFDRAVTGIRVLPPVPGGATRQDSVRHGLEALAAYRPDRVLIHDGARPFPDSGLVGRVIDGLDRAAAAIPCLPLRDTIKRAEGGTIRETDRPFRPVAGADPARLSLRRDPCRPSRGRRARPDRRCGGRRGGGADAAAGGRQRG